MKGKMGCEIYGVFRQMDTKDIHSLSGIALSILFHGIVIGTTLAAVHFVQPPRPILSIDLSLLENMLPAREFQAPQEVAQIKPPPEKIIKKIARPRPVVKKAAPKPKPVVKEEQIVKQESIAAPEMEDEPLPFEEPEVMEEVFPEMPEEIVDVPDTPLPLPVMPMASAIRNAIAKAPPMAVRQKNPQERYLSAHFLYIKDNIQKSINYPKIARRMGWEGRVVLSFIICKNGAVTNIKVVKSSGYAILDNNAVTTIRQSAPFPKPPVRAELTVPISYRLS
jgi:protein TonB